MDYEALGIWLAFWALSSYLLSLKSKSKIIIIGTGFLISTIGFAMLVATVNIIAEQKEKEVANNAGFSTYEEYAKAAAAGFKTKAAYDQFIALKERQKKEAFQREQARKKLAQQQQDAIKKAIRDKEKKAKEDACKKDLQCWAEHNFAYAEVECPKQIERLAKYDFEWTDKGWFNHKFDRFRWHNKTDGSVTYAGDKIKLQNGFGAWQIYNYECDYDTTHKVVLDVRVHPGRLR